MTHTCPHCQSWTNYACTKGRALYPNATRETCDDFAREVGTDDDLGEAVYDASCIRILSPEQAVERFGFARAGDLIARYPSSSPDFIRRMVEACQLSGWPIEEAERRYLAGDRSVAPTPEFIACHRELADQRQ